MQTPRVSQEVGSSRVYTRRKRTTELQPVERQAKQTQFELQPEEEPQLVDQRHTSATNVDISNNGMNESIETGGEEIDPFVDLPIALRKEATSKT